MSHVDYLLADRDRLVDENKRFREILHGLEVCGIITMKEEDAQTCCGTPRDDEGFCSHRRHHPIYVSFAG